MSKSAYFLTSLLLIIPSTYLKAFALSKCWQWFVAETFGLRLLTLPQSYGLCIFASLFVIGLMRSDDKTDTDKERLESFSGSIARSFVVQPLILLMGYITYYYFIK